VIYRDFGVRQTSFCANCMKIGVIYTDFGVRQTNFCVNYMKIGVIYTDFGVIYTKCRKTPGNRALRSP
jgi:hypothetical protein